ncbi:MAG TPA: phosphatase PAP2 family protein [Labilithrix sp.]|nr:phosphatase PAP2 family protein [Labilithrix sp.]
MLRRISSLFTLLAVTTTAGTLRAETPTPTEPGAPVVWNETWPRFRAAEVAFTGGMALNVAMALFLYPAPKNNWDGPILIDKPVRSSLTLADRDARNVAASVSDGIYYALAAYPIIDTVAVASVAHGNADLTVQMLAIDLESYAFGGAIALSAEKAGRRRPMARNCEANPSYDKKCGDDDNLNASFLSGHTTIGFVGAGLLCAHHLNVPLYGGGTPDTATCVAGMSAAITGGVLRVMSDNHYASDVVLGAGVGVMAGYLMPVLLHYGRSGGTPKRDSWLPHFSIPAAGAYGVVAPTFGTNEGGMSLTGAF